MKTITIKWTTLILCLFGISMNSQESILASGGNASSAGGSVSYSVGQIAYVYANDSGGSASQGIQQPFEIFVLGINDFPEITLQMNVYPNPTKANATLNIANYNAENISYELFDLSGKQIVSQKITSTATQIQMEEVSSAIYFLKILDQNKVLKTFKIIKN
jgi:Secretion system C-terminal sorting domain